MTNWKDLIVYNDEATPQGTLIEMVEIAPANLDDAVIENNVITEWLDWFIAAPGENHSEYSPEGEVDWTGFEEALASARGLVPS